MWNFQQKGLVTGHVLEVPVKMACCLCTFLFVLQIMIGPLTNNYYS